MNRNKGTLVSLLSGVILATASIQAHAFSIVTVSAAQVGKTITLGGTVIPYKEVTLSAEFPGRITFIAGSEGDDFDEGEELVAVDHDDLLAQRRAAEAALNSARSSLRNAQVQYSREMWSPNSQSLGRMPGMGLPSMMDNMFTKNMGSMFGYGDPAVERRADLYSQGSQVEQTMSSVASAQSKMDEIDAKLRDARAVAPFEGVIVKKMVEEGDTVQVGKPLMVFAHTKFLRIRVEVPARLVPGITPGMFVPARLDVGGTRVQARVANIYPVANHQKHTVTVKLDLPEGIPGGAGMYAEVALPDITAPQRNLPIIPEESLVKRGSLPGVYILNEDNRAELRLVRTGVRLGGGMVAVLSGLKSGERLVVDPPPGIVSGWSPNIPQ